MWLGVCVRACVCARLCKIAFPSNDFQTNFPIDTKFSLRIILYQNSPTLLIPFLNFQILHLIMGLIYELDHWNLVYR